MKYKIILVIFVCVSIAAVVSSAQVYPDSPWENGFTEPWHFCSDHYPKEAATGFKTRWSLMEQEAKETHLDEWSGLYTLGIFDLRGYAFRWSPDRGYVYASVDACRGNVDGVSYGKIRLSGNLIEVIPEINTSTIPRGIEGPKKYYLVRNKYLRVMWGQQHYLVPEDKVALFYDYVTGRGQYQLPGPGYIASYFWQKYDDRDKPSFGMPVLPPGYERFAKKPLEPIIVSVGPSQVVRRNGSPDPYYELVTSMRLAGGTKNGIRRGMQLYVAGKGTESVEITRTALHSSWGIIRHDLDDDQKAHYKDWPPEKLRDFVKISVGRRLTTTPP